MLSLQHIYILMYESPKCIKKFDDLVLNIDY